MVPAMNQSEFMKKPLLLCLSKNPELLAIRQRVLATRYDVVPIGNLGEMETLPSGSVFDLLVLCHTLPDYECEKAVRLARQRWPGIKVLAITAASFDRSEQDADLAVGALEGPLAMFSRISRLIPTPTA